MQSWNRKKNNIIFNIQVTFDENERIELYKKAQEIFHKDAPWVLLAHTTPPIGFADYT